VSFKKFSKIGDVRFRAHDMQAAAIGEIPPWPPLLTHLPQSHDKMLRSNWLDAVDLSNPLRQAVVPCHYVRQWPGQTDLSTTSWHVKM